METLKAAEQRRLKESLVLLDIATAVSSTLNLTHVLKLIAQRTAEACEAHRCSIFLLDEQGQRIVPLMSQYASGAADKQLWERFRHQTYVQKIGELPVLTQVIQDRQPLVLGGATLSALPETWITPFKIQSLLMAPLVSRDRVIGMMALDYVEPGRRFGREQINLAMTIGSQVAAAIENARLFEQLGKRAERLTLLSQISMALTSTLNLDEILRTTVVGLSQLFEVEQCGVIIFDEERNLGRLVAEYPQREGTESVTIPLRGNLSTERILATRQPLAIEDAQHDPLLDSIRDVTLERGVKSILIAPLLLRGEVLGTISLDVTKDRRVFTAEEIELVQTIANQVSVAIENARLNQQTIQEKAKTEIILQETFSGIVVADDRLRIVSLNPGAERITGYPAREALGQRLSDVLGAKVAAPDSPLTRAIETREKVPPLETTLSGKAGSKDILLGVTPLPGSEESPSGYLLSFTDISKLKEIDRLKSNIVASVSHELRTPLASIRAYTELLLGSIGDTDETPRREWLLMIERETQRLTAMINDFLDLSYLESGRWGATRAPVRLDKLIADVVDSLTVQAEQRRIHIALQVEPGLPQFPVDSGLMVIAVKNLVSNAIKFSHDGGRIRISIWEDADDFRFRVEDEGIGIPPEAIPRLFTKFYRVPSDSAAGLQGTGLGLALAKEAVAAHGGRIEVESALGKGSRFTVSIPKAARPRVGRVA